MILCPYLLIRHRKHLQLLKTSRDFKHKVEKLEIAERLRLLLCESLLPNVPKAHGWTKYEVSTVDKEQ